MWLVPSKAEARKLATVINLHILVVDDDDDDDVCFQ